MIRSGPALTLLLAAGPVAVAGGLWKTKVATGVNRSVHEKHSERARNILILKDGGPGTSEWRIYGSLIDEATGTVRNDANSHGNVIIALGERDKEGPEDLTDELRKAPLAFNGGPFYRWWTRIIEANGQYNLGLPSRPANGLGSWRRPMLPTRDAKPVYRYMGYMTHLVQDNCSPAHAANIRHGIYEGIEYWHWQSIPFGGQGLDVPQETVSALLDQMNGDSQKFWRQEAFKKFWKQARESVLEPHAPEKYNRGLSGINPEDPSQRNTIEANMRAVIDDTRKLYMPDAQRLKTTNIFRLYDWPNPGRRAHELDPPGSNDVKRMWDYEDASVLMGTSKKYPLSGEAPAGASSDIQDAGRLLQRIYTKPQYQVDPSTANAAERRWVTNTFSGHPIGSTTSPLWWWDRTPTAGTDPFQDPAAKPLNAHRMPYLPNPDYVGRGFDLNWGSYGGFFGYPGRKQVDVNASIGTDLFRNDARITPGDLYCQHSSQEYDPRDNHLLFGYRDERTLRDLKAHPHYVEIGNAQVKNSVFWTASLLHSLSMALPPVLTHFQVDPRVPRRVPLGIVVPRLDLDLTSLLALPKLGAYITLGFETNRATEPYRMEFFAIPKAQIKEVNGRPRRQNFSAGMFLNCTREISQGPQKALYASDFGIEDLGGDTTWNGNPPDPAPQVPVFYRDYDFVYAQLSLFPLKVCLTNPVDRNGCLQPGQITLPNLGIRLAGSTLIANPQSDAPQAHAFKSGNLSFIWDGQVGKAVDWAGAEDPRGSAYLTQVPQAPGTYTLKSGEYFILAVVYREGLRDAFASNQFKLTNAFKERLEDLQWWQADWAKVMDGTPNHPLDNAKQKILIPDELFPVLIDSGAIRLGIQ